MLDYGPKRCIPSLMLHLRAANLTGIGKVLLRVVWPERSHSAFPRVEGDIGAFVDKINFVEC